MEVVITTGVIRRAKLQSNVTNAQFFYRLDAPAVAQPIYLSIDRSIDLLIDLSIDLSIYRSIYLESRD